MIGRKMVMMAAAVVLAGVMAMPAMVQAKACPALCKDVIKACKQTCTEKPKAACKRACKKRIVGYCKDNAKTCPTSPSGAFLD